MNENHIALSRTGVVAILMFGVTVGRIIYVPSDISWVLTASLLLLIALKDATTTIRPGQYRRKWIIFRRSAE